MVFVNTGQNIGQRCKICLNSCRLTQIAIDLKTIRAVVAHESQVLVTLEQIYERSRVGRTLVTVLSGLGHIGVFTALKSGHMGFVLAALASGVGLGLTVATSQIGTLLSSSTLVGAVSLSTMSPTSSSFSDTVRLIFRGLFALDLILMIRSWLLQDPDSLTNIGAAVKLQRQAVDRFTGIQEALSEQLRITESTHKYEFRYDRFNIGFIGQPKAGKSSLVNALRQLPPSFPTAARVGQEEHVHNHPFGYEYIKYHGSGGELDAGIINNRCVTIDGRPATLWDMPGGGTKRHPWSSYWTDCFLTEFDLIVFVFCDRPDEAGLALAARLQQVGKRVIFVRTKMDESIRCITIDKELKEEDSPKQVVVELAKLRDITIKRLLNANIERPELFLVSYSALRGVENQNGKQQRLVDDAQFVSALEHCPDDEQ